MGQEPMRRVLVCERAGLRATAIETALRRAGVEVVVVETRLEALRELRRGRCDAVLLGCFAPPSGDALTLGRYVREGGVANVDRDLPLVVMTAEKTFGELVGEVTERLGDRYCIAPTAGVGLRERPRVARLRRASGQGGQRGDREGR